ncbi:RHTO0S11e06040g1_1 [Rhodotorula toruloides]|uniref:RHTO0S11e06040g1_1 n=1 Tax=Rhodotorula toruloides TaxID=5286 RepID=A0A061B7K7_RHOTO|nr:RHTO0S11e06040g1_1 [Rhodotorula toruloides]
MLRSPSPPTTQVDLVLLYFLIPKAASRRLLHGDGEIQRADSAGAYEDAVWADMLRTACSSLHLLSLALFLCLPNRTTLQTRSARYTVLETAQRSPRCTVKPFFASTVLVFRLWTEEPPLTNWHSPWASTRDARTQTPVSPQPHLLMPRICFAALTSGDLKIEV